ncbi:ATP-binding protein [Selenomonas sp. KH1T6]|uniref:ATP-binding protein n=1 Tax=Selenomonas sp. KH1T6 TaxID=3158784 RepID=UPI0008A7D128|nr:PD-(D/E)XK nuclease superfamily protein [Selenomonas ruminantium]
MAEAIRKLPIGVQSFEVMRQEQFLYVDKTRYIYELAHTGRQYFLSRPRRFGKSLFLSTLKAYWQGRKELFEGLEIAELEKDSEGAFEPYPVFYFDFNGQDYQAAALEDVLDGMLSDWEKIYGCEKGGLLSDRFKRLLEAAREKTGKKCVVLVDEYDKPLLEVLENDELEEHNKAVFKGFFGTLKTYDEHLRFVFITGVTKFSKVSIFSDLNQLQDISMFEEYSGICGMTGEEICANFQPELQAMAAKRKMSEEKCLQKLARKYDGYHFFPGCQGVYNPFSVLNALSKKGFSDFWFSTGTPTFLVRRLKNMHFDVRQFAENTIYADAVNLSDYRADNPDIVPLLYQTGYLTIVGADSEEGPYILGFPNEEVRLGFLKSLFPEYAPTAVTGSGKDIFALRSHILAGDTEELKETFAALFASIPYTTKDAPFEHYFQTVVYLVFTLLGQYVHAEVHSSRGRADCVLETDKFVYIFEFKVDKSAREALEQIEEKGYAAPYGADERQLFKIGVNFDSESRSLSEWLVG